MATEPTGLSPIQRKFQLALQELVERIQEDRTVLACILCGSLSYDNVWEKSDIDLMLVTTEDLKGFKSVTLLAGDIPVHATIMPRSRFKQSVQRATQTSFIHSLLSKSTLLFARDETLRDHYEGITRVGQRDQEIQLLSLVCGMLPALTKAEKWHKVKHNWHYTYFWILKCMDALASIEVVSQGHIPSREVVAQALQLNPAFFGSIYTDLMDQPKTEANTGAALDSIIAYLDAKKEIFDLLLEYLHEARGPRTATEIDHHFDTHHRVEAASSVCEWLAARGKIESMGMPVRLIDKSKVTLEGAAYYYSHD